MSEVSSICERSERRAHGWKGYARPCVRSEQATAAEGVGPRANRKVRPALAFTAAMFVAVTLVFALPASAQSCPPNKTAAECVRAGLGTTANTAGLGTEATPLAEIVGNIIYAALSLTGVIFVILIVYGGFIWMQARGNQEDVTKAKKIIESAIIGIVITALAFALTQFVLNRIIEAQTPGVEVAD